MGMIYLSSPLPSRRRELGEEREGDEFEEQGEEEEEEDREKIDP